MHNPVLLSKLWRSGTQFAKYSFDEYFCQLFDNNNIIIQSDNLSGTTIVKQRTPQLGAGILIEPRFEGVVEVPTAPEVVVLTPEQQEKMLAHIKKGRMPDGVKKRIMDKITSGTIPKSMYDRITEGMG